MIAVLASAPEVAVLLGIALAAGAVVATRRWLGRSIDTGCTFNKENPL